ncbi:MAG: DUF4442 domain-containing protein [Planctomycetota bacterium]|nr:MAG: DUF4442 domain-containing protein [Planctomycetota bacterium]
MIGSELAAQLLQRIPGGDALVRLGANPVRTGWDLLSPLPGGNVLFSRLIGRLAPYSGSVGAVVEQLGPGRSVVRLDDRRAVRNHLGSVHAVALMNLAELSSGLAFLYALPEDARAILTGLSIDFRKKARGRLRASCEAPVPETNAQQEFEVEATVRDGRGDVVALATARWLVGPVPRR